MSESSEPSAREAEEPGLPGLRTWKGVYLFVFASFILWVGLLIVLTEVFS
jgi:hypothetical protein